MKLALRMVGNRPEVFHAQTGELLEDVLEVRFSADVGAHGTLLVEVRLERDFAKELAEKARR